MHAPVQVVRISGGIERLFGGWKDEKKAQQFKRRLDHYGSIWCCVNAHPGHIWCGASTCQQACHCRPALPPADNMTRATCVSGCHNCPVFPSAPLAGMTSSGMYQITKTAMAGLRRKMGCGNW